MVTLFVMVVAGGSGVFFFFLWYVLLSWSLHTAEGFVVVQKSLAGGRLVRCCESRISTAVIHVGVPYTSGE